MKKFVVLLLCAVLLCGGWWGYGMWQDWQESQIPVWEKKITLTDQVVKIGLITDTHIDSERVVENGVRSSDKLDITMEEVLQEHLERFVTQMGMYKPDFIVHMGDVIDAPNGTSQERGIIELGFVREALERADLPLYWAIGNHDLRGITRNDFIKTLDSEAVNYTIDHGEAYRFIVLDANFGKNGMPHNPMTGDYTPGFMTKETLSWLEKELQTDRHVYVFLHHSLIPQRYTGKKSIKNDEVVRALFERYHVRAVFDGHIERRYFMNINGVDYYAFPGTKKNKHFKGSFYEMTIVNGQPEIVMYYKDAITGDEVTEPYHVEEKMYVREEK